MFHVKHFRHQFAVKYFTAEIVMKDFTVDNRRQESSARGPITILKCAPAFDLSEFWSPEGRAALRVGATVKRRSRGEDLFRARSSFHRRIRH